MLTSGKFLVSFEVPGPLPGTTEGFCEEMNVVYRTEELNTYLRYPKQQINPWHKHSTYIRLKLREILKVNLTDITIIDIILSVGTILTLIRNEKIYQAHKHTHPTNKLRYIISQILILILYTSSLILVSYTYRIILTHL
jgi:hypothetical protein